MTRPRIVTFTLNPAIDVSSEADTVRHTHKVRTRDEAIEPGGGGINVARVLSRLGDDVCALFLGGGTTGQVLDQLLERAGIERRMIAIAGDTRMSLTVVERSTGREYRFVPEGPEVSAAEAQAALDAAASLPCDYFVASGSLPRGVQDSFYADLCRIVTGRGARFVLDTSGAELRNALESGGIFLVKPSRGEFEALAGRPLDTDGLLEEAKRLVQGGKVANVAVTLGRDGAIFVNSDFAQALPAIGVEACSAVGAGDSFLAGIVHGFAAGEPPATAFRIGLAAGAAAVLSCGSELASRADLERLVSKALQAER